MLTVYNISVENDEIGEVEGMFDADCNILDAWYSNDGVWRGEYFDNFLRKLNIKIYYPRRDEELYTLLEQKLIEHFNYD